MSSDDLFADEKSEDEEEVDVMVQQRKDEVCKVLKGTVPINKGYMLVDIRMTLWAFPSPQSILDIAITKVLEVL